MFQPEFEVESESDSSDNDNMAYAVFEEDDGRVRERGMAQYYKQPKRSIDRN